MIKKDSRRLAVVEFIFVTLFYSLSVLVHLFIGIICPCAKDATPDIRTLLVIGTRYSSCLNYLGVNITSGEPSENSHSDEIALLDG